MVKACGYLLVAHGCQPCQALCTITEIWELQASSCRSTWEPPHALRRPARPSATRLRGRLQPRAVAAGGVAGGRTADAGGRRHDGVARHLRLVPDRAPAGHVRLGMARPGHRDAARGRDRGGPGDADRGAARLVLPGPPRGTARHPGGRPPGLRLTRCHLPLRPRLPGRRGDDHHPARRTLRQPPGRRAVARPQRVRRPRAHLLLRHLRRRLPGVAAGAVRQHGQAQRRLGCRLLGPALRRLGRDHPAPRHPHRRQPRPATGLPALRRRGRPRQLHR